MAWLYAAARHRGHPDPARDALAGFSEAAEEHHLSAVAARLALPWPLPELPGTAPPQSFTLPGAQALQAYGQAAVALVENFRGCAPAALVRLEARLARRPVRTLAALHHAWCSAWQAERAARIQHRNFALQLCRLAHALSELTAAEALAARAAGTGAPA